MAKANLEIGLEDTICSELTDYGWLYEAGGADKGFDAGLALYPEDVLAWLSSQYPDEYRKVIPDRLTGRDLKRAQRSLLEDLATQLDKKPVVNRKTGQSTGGLMGVLHTGFVYSRPGRSTARFGAMVAFSPADPTIIAARKRSQANVLRVIRQVHFDTERTKDTIDVMLLVNGIPVVTMELKADSSQNVIDAMEQYKSDRKPVKTSRVLRPGRCLVHFAVSDAEVYMTTKLAGNATTFLPFNRGRENGHAGNDPIPGGIATEYLWKQVLERELFLRILGNFAFFEPKNKRVGADGTLIFPRYHQLRAVERVVADISEQGPGQPYLIWHSAGSGKTKTIAWLAHRLSRHVMPNGEPTFDSVILVSDRTVLDKNLRDSVQMLRASEGLVVPIEHGSEAKSERLNEALTVGNAIITCTLQTFPEVLSRIESREDLEGRRWAVIADEAHSSQTGRTANALRELLADDGELGDDEDEIAADDLLLLKKRRTAQAANITFIAFTATPKEKTLALFGTAHDGKKAAFDTYTMAQAIQEGFILDVLTNYSTYEMFARVAAKAEESDEVELDRAVSDVYKFVRLHDTAISQKVQIVVEHFKENVLGELDGQARAMVVTSSRANAVRWALQMNKYIEAKGYGRLFKALVAFSEKVTLKETGDLEYTEASMNGGGDVEEKFKDDKQDYRVMIVANKFQTGFNEPRLIAMYVDKKLNGVATVQTLSRLNRTHAGKTTTMVLDFVNDPESILTDFKKYYQSASITEELDPAELPEMGTQLDAYGFYDHDDMDAITKAELDGKDATHRDFVKVLQPIADAWLTELMDARRTGDDDAVKTVMDFRRLVRSYISAWELYTQILDYRDADLHKRALLLSHLQRYLVDRHGPSEEDYAARVRLEGLSMQPKLIEEDLGLTKTDSEDDEWGALSFVPSRIGGGADTPELGPLDKVVDAVNEMLAAQNAGVERQAVAGFISTTWGKVMANQEIKGTVLDNTPEQLRNSTAFSEKLLQLLWQQRKSNEEISDLVMFDEKGRRMFASQLLEEMIRLRENGELE